jgi:hypothetical protein
LGGIRRFSQQRRPRHYAPRPGRDPGRPGAPAWWPAGLKAANVRRPGGHPARWPAALPGATQHLIDTYLEPRWLVRIAGDPHPVAAALAGEAWATRAEPVGADAIRAEATSIEAGERGIPAVIAGCGARQVSCEPVAADLESAFLALTGASSQE